MADIQILFPMGGLGSRFSNVGIETPKPLIEVDGVPMILKAVSSFARLPQDRLQLLFVVRAEHNAQYDLQNKITAVCPNAKFQVLDHNTKGAVETCMMADPLIDRTKPIVVMDCDLYFQSKAYEEALVAMAEEGLAGLLLYFKSKAPRYSFAELDAEHRVVRTAEKIPISENALIGAYGFGSGEIFLNAGKKLLERNISAEMKEYYLSLLYNILLSDGLTVKAVPMDEYHSFGTPEELELYRAGKRSYVVE